MIDWGSIQSTGGGVLVNRVTSNDCFCYSGNRYIVDASSGPIELTLDPSAEDGSVVSILVIDDTHSITLDKGGRSLLGDSDNIPLIAANAGLELILNTNNNEWLTTQGYSNITYSGDTPATVKSKYESNENTNEFSNEEKNKLGTVEEGAQKNTVISVNNKTGAVSLDKADIGLSAVENTAQVPLNQKGIPGGVATLDANGIVMQLPPSIANALTSSSVDNETIFFSEATEKIYTKPIIENEIMAALIFGGLL